MLINYFSLVYQSYINCMFKVPSGEHRRVTDKENFPLSSVQFSSVVQSCLTLCNPMNCSMPGLPVHHQLLEFTQLTSIESVMPPLLHGSICLT